jgi:hypothetical protein
MWFVKGGREMYIRALKIKLIEKLAKSLKVRRPNGNKNLLFLLTY